ncbi:MAG: exonuclease sbcCD subunit D [Rhodobacteraceae bacterium PARR1]|nr:MAG: exonuclease sbcCD subunit D [Rhodobacteraceae bacterium PARR1]
MRVLHTADWHIGQTLNGWSREAEHALFLSRLADVIEGEAIDLVLVAGDVFDTTNPSGESQQLLYRALAEFRRRRPGVVIVISGGNHDPALRLEAPADVFHGFDIHIVGTVRRVGDAVDLGTHLIPVKGPDGAVALYVLAIPFLRAADLTGLRFSEAEDGLTVTEAASRFHADLTAAAARVAGDLPLIAMGHLHCAGGLESEGAERRLFIGGTEGVPPDIFPPRLDYVALGHLHGPQSLDGGRVRYSGSAFPLSASEIRYRHGVTILGIDGRTITNRHHDIPWPAPVLRLPTSGVATLAELETALAAIPASDDPALRPLVYVELLAEDAPAVMMARAAALLRAAPVRPAGIRIHRPETKAAERPVLRALRDTLPEDLFLDAYRKKHGTPPEDRHLAAFRDAMDGV